MASEPVGEEKVIGLRLGRYRGAFQKWAADRGFKKDGTAARVAILIMLRQTSMPTDFIVTMERAARAEERFQVSIDAYRDAASALQTARKSLRACPPDKSEFLQRHVHALEADATKSLDAAHRDMIAWCESVHELVGALTGNQDDQPSPHTLSNSAQPAPGA